MTGGPRGSLEDRLKYALVPPRLYIRLRAWRELRRGEAEARILPLLVDPGRAAVDAGANKGVFTQLLSRLTPRVYAYECNPRMLRLLRRTAAPGVEVRGAALADRSGTLDLYLPYGRKGYSNQGASILARKVAGGSFDVTTVPTLPLDAEGLPPVGFMKIDVEGAELMVLRGAAGVIARDRPTLLVEMEERHTGRPLAEMLEEVLAFGYRGLFLHAGRLHDLSRLDPRVHGDPRDRANYVFNFIFLPQG